MLRSLGEVLQIIFCNATHFRRCRLLRTWTFAFSVFCQARHPRTRGRLFPFPATFLEGLPFLLNSAATSLRKRTFGA